MRPNLPGLACHMAYSLLPAGNVRTHCGRLVLAQAGRLTTDPKKVSCRQCLRVMRVRRGA